MFKVWVYNRFNTQHRLTVQTHLAGGVGIYMGQPTTSSHLIAVAIQEHLLFVGSQA